MIKPADLNNLKDEKARNENPRSDPSFPSDPFACPACGQMLAPSVRVCVACKQPIDLSRVERPEAVAATPEIQAGLRAADHITFSWQMFLTLLVIWLLAVRGSEMLWGPTKAQIALGAIQIFSSVWVFFDAGARMVPKPLRWALGSLLLWIVIFPWYLVRRRTPLSSCPFVEAEVGPLTRKLFLVLVICFLLAAIFLVLKGPMP